MAAATHRGTTVFTSVTWVQTAKETKKDADMLILHEAVYCGFRDDARHLPAVAQYWQYHDSLHESGGTFIYNECAVMLRSLQSTILAMLHSVHQGVLLVRA